MLSMTAILGFNGILKVVSVCHICIPTLFTLTNQSNVWLALYSFGNPNLFIYYRLMKGLLDFNNTDGASKLLELIKAEYHSSSKRFHHLLSQNPEWITALVMVITLHELGHHRFKKDRNSYQLLASDVKEFLQNRPFKVSKDYVPNAELQRQSG